MGKIRGYLHLIRPINCMMMGFAVVVGAAVADPASIEKMWTNLAFGFVTGFILTGASMAINDYYDRNIDAVNEPNRPIPSGLIKPNEGLIFAFGLTVIGFAAAFLTNSVYPLCLFVAIIAWGVFVMYTTVGKRSGLLGNFLVSICVAIPFIYGSIAIVNGIAVNVLIFVSMVFLSTAGREITKGIADIRGDEQQEMKTLAVRYGEKTAAIVATIFYLSAVILSPIPWIMGIVSIWYIPFVALTDFGLLLSSIMILKNRTKENARRIKNVVLFWLCLGLLAFLLGALR